MKIGAQTVGPQTKIGAMVVSRCVRRIAGMLAVGAVLLTATQGWAWSHQGHILITRMAALRIINDDKAPEDLRAFLKKHMKYDLAACEKLATSESVGAKAENYLVGLDGACTLPDRIIETDEGKEKIEPYGAPEAKMHFLDQEEFSKERVYKDDLSNWPPLTAFVKDPKDVRYLAAGFLPFRVEESYDKFVKALGKKGEAVNDAEALKWLGYLAHYMEDAHQPQHGTVDYKSLSYLVGKVPEVHAIKRTGADGQEYITYVVNRDKTRLINPHGDLEFQLFENAKEPRKGLREQYWKMLTAGLTALDQMKPTETPVIETDRFTWTLRTMAYSYQYLPVIGRAAQAAYAKGSFEPEPFFTHKEKVVGREVSVLEMIAAQNALAITEVDRAIRKAWEEAKK